MVHDKLLNVSFLIFPDWFSKPDFERYL